MRIVICWESGTTRGLSIAGFRQLDAAKIRPACQKNVALRERKLSRPDVAGQAADGLNSDVAWIDLH